VQISPNVSVVLTIAYVILTGLSVPTLTALGFTTSAPIILAWCGMIGTVLGAILHAFSSSAPGFAAPADAPVVVAAQKVADLPSNASAATISEAKSEARAAVSAHQP
jgi:hypothetical protein